MHQTSVAGTQAEAIGATRSPSGSKRPDGLAEEAQHHPAEEGYPCHLRADKRDGNP